jgi:transcriptional regulator with XRE-family HTH domain
MLKALGKQLKTVRGRQGLSLQAAAEPAGITAPYLQKLERGLVMTPSPRVLARLGLVLDVPYLRLMKLAGYLDEPQLAQARSRKPTPHPLQDQALSPEEWRAVGDFIRKLKNQRQAARSNRRPARERQ